MEEKKLTDEEIVQALEDMASECETNFSASVVDLIHRLQADNIQFKWNYVELKERYVKVLDLNEKVIAKQKAEIERLTEVRNDFRQEVITLNNEKLELQKQVDVLKIELQGQFDKGVKAGCLMSKVKEKQAVKDTAKEIIQWIKRNGTLQYGGYVIHDSTIEQMCKKYGVEAE